MGLCKPIHATIGILKESTEAPILIDASFSNVPADVHLSETVHICSPDDGIGTVSGLRFHVRLQDVECEHFFCLEYLIAPFDRTFEIFLFDGVCCCIMRP